jgi:signal transduction histidine kinase
MTVVARHTSEESALGRFVGMGQRSGRVRILVLLGGIILLVLTGVVDAKTGPTLSVELFYLIPVALVTAVAGPGAGASLAFATVPVSLAADATLHHHPGMGLLAANAVLRVVVLLTIVGLLAALRAALKAAQASERNGREFLGMAAHQLRTPLAGIGTTAEALLLQGVEPDQEQLLAALASEAQRAGHLVADLLRVARLDLQEQFDRSPEAVDRLCEQELQRARALAPRLRFMLECTGEGPFVALVNREGFQEAIANLLDNGSRFAETTVDVRVSRGSGSVSVEVGDDGPGVPAGEQERIFERFVSLDGGGSTGLGLPIARTIIQRNEGDLRYEHGRFVVTVPAVRTGPF